MTWSLKTLKIEVLFSTDHLYVNPSAVNPGSESIKKVKINHALEAVPHQLSTKIPCIFSVDSPSVGGSKKSTNTASKPSVGVNLKPKAANHQLEKTTEL